MKAKDQLAEVCKQRDLYVVLEGAERQAQGTGSKQKKEQGRQKGGRESSKLMVEERRVALEATEKAK